MKKCIHCGEQKPFSEYHKKKANKDGFQNTCKLGLFKESTQNLKSAILYLDKHSNKE